MKIISPSILSCDFLNLEQGINDLNNTSCEWLHLDVMDGNFVPNITFGYQLVEKINNITQKTLDVHLMLENPQEYIKKFADAGSDYITFHVEANGYVKEIIDEIHSYGKKAGIAIKPNTSISEIIDYLPFVDLVLVMSVEPGFGGQTFIASSEKKINELKQIKDDKQYNFLISVDGGINDKTKNKANKADVLVSGSYLFDENMEQKIDLLRD